MAVSLFQQLVTIEEVSTWDSPPSMQLALPLPIIESAPSSEEKDEAEASVDDLPDYDE